MKMGHRSIFRVGLAGVAALALAAGCATQQGVDTEDVQGEVYINLYFSEEPEALDEAHLFAFSNVLNIQVAVKLKEPKTVQRSEGKAVRVVDKRKAL